MIRNLDIVLVAEYGADGCFMIYFNFQNMLIRLYTITQSVYAINIAFGSKNAHNIDPVHKTTFQDGWREFDLRSLK